ncbi:MAG: bacillithiol system redox-active protein YtxJ [Bacteroidota bacterium]
MLDWIKLNSLDQLDHIVAESSSTPTVIFKHSTRCSISSIAKMRLEDRWDFTADELKAYYLDLISYRAISNAVADRFAVHHESPQLLLIRNGECTYEASHLDISVEELKECFEDIA